MVQMLTAYGEGRANVNDVMRALVSHRDWFVPLALLVQGGEQNRKVESVLMLSTEAQMPPGELWVFTDSEAAGIAQAKGASLGAYAGGIAGTELFRIIDPNFQTVRVNPGSPRERTWTFQEGSASEVGKVWADAIALEECFDEWQQTGQPDEAAVMNYRAFMTFDFSSGPIVTLPNQGGMASPAAAFTAPDCAQMFLSKLGEEQSAGLQSVTIDGRTLMEKSPQLGIDGLMINIFGPGATFAFPFKHIRPAEDKPSRTLMILLSDGLRLPTGFVAASPYRCLVYCKVPGDWVEGVVAAESDELWLKGPSLRPDKFEGLFEALYGKTWRSGNSDGSQYVVEVGGARLLNPLREAEKPWQHSDANDKQYRYFYFVADTDGQFKPVSPAEL
jgi:hypothetical protein